MEVIIKKVEPGRFVSFYGYGSQPEEIAMQKFEVWCSKRKLDASKALVYGFNNPNPTPNFSEYGYEIWLKDHSAEKPEDDARIIEFHGGNYAVVECVGALNMLQSWKALYAWCIEHKYKLGYHQALEQMIENNSDFNKMKFELYCPIIV